MNQESCTWELFTHETLVVLVYGIIAVSECTACAILIVAQSSWAAEYTDWISAEEHDSPKECRGYDTKQSDSEASVMLDLWVMLCTSYNHQSQVHSSSEL